VTEFAHELIRAQSEVRPNASALVDVSGRGITYSELMLQVAHLAGQLRALGVGPDERVAVRLDRSAETVVSMLAILEAGGAYVPMDDSYPAARTQMVVKDVGARVLIARNMPPGVPSQLPVVDPAGAVQAEHSAAPIGLALHPDNLAYVVHTSGSTGHPKGVAMSHRGLMRLIRWQIADGPRALTTLQFTATGFDVTFQEVLSTLGTGGTLLLASEELRRNPGLLLSTLQERSVQRLFLPYFALHQLAKAAQHQDTVPSSLQHVVTAGEALIITDAISDFFRRLPGCRLDNHYGPTETHLVSRFTLPEDRIEWPVQPSIGTPVAQVSVYNLGADLMPVPAGQTGELYVGGVGLARGYLNDPALTAERFLPDPFSGQPGMLMYRTGDVVRTDAEGRLYFVGRTDSQVKVRGFRVEPAEVEAALLAHPRVLAAAVGLRELAAGVVGLVGYVVAEGSSPRVRELSAHLRELLPAYMVPSQFVFLDALPLTVSGKVDNRALSRVYLPPLQGEAGSEAYLIRTVSAIWERVLGHGEFGPEDDFFDVGGDSLLAAWVVTELSQALDRTVDLSVFLRDSTAAGLARELDGAGTRQTAQGWESQIVTLRPGPAHRVLYLLHPLGGELLPYRELVQAINSPLRVLGIRWGGEPSGESLPLEEIVAVHYSQLRAIQPDGPYLLAGWSFGGVLAYELALQLTASGERVDFLGMLDANPTRDPLTGLRTRATAYLDLLTAVLSEIDKGFAEGKPAGDLSQFATDKSWTGLMGDVVPQGVSASHLRRSLRIAQCNMRAAMTYQPASYGGPIDLFQAAGSDPEIQDLLAAELRALACGPVRIHQVPGDHQGILRAPQVEATGAAVDKALQSIKEVRGGHGS